MLASGLCRPPALVGLLAVLIACDPTVRMPADAPVGRDEGLSQAQLHEVAMLARLARNSPCDDGLLPPEPLVEALAPQPSRDYEHMRETADTVTVDGRPLPPLQTDNRTDLWKNEQHDCQRLVVPDAPTRRFGPLVGIFPQDPVNFDQSSDFAQPVAAAIIFNYGGFNGPERYADLGLDPGWNCLWMRADAVVGGQHRWRAAITPGFCPYLSPPQASAFDVLKVERVQHADPHAIYPPTARWGWDANSATHYVGSRCAEAWCSIGVQAATLPTRLDGGPFWQTIPGWYDEQHLAVATEQAGAPVVPGPWGRISPTTALFDAHHSDVTDTFRRGLDAAEIQLTDEPAHGAAGRAAKYQEKLNLNAANRARLFLKVENPAPVAWRAEFNGQPLVDKSVGYLAHTRHAAAGAVRWRWFDTDEQAWVSCEGGCCDVPLLRSSFN